MSFLVRDLIMSGLRILAMLAMVGIAVLCFVFWAASMPGNGTPQATRTENKALARALEVHVRSIAGERNTTQAAALDRAAAYIENDLKKMGFRIDSQWLEAGGIRVRNLFVIVPAAMPDAGVVVVGAHYDSAYGTIGADDNASGVAGLLEIARSISGRKDDPLKRELHLVFFTNEEPPYFGTQQMGSYRYAESLSRNKRKVEAMLSLEMLGYYCDVPGCQKYPLPLSVAFPDKGNFIAFVGNLDSRELTRRVVGSFRQHAAIPSEGVTAPTFIQGVDYSDQLWFWRFGYPAVMVTDTSFMRYSHYHKATDTPEKLDYVRLSLVVDALVPSILELCSNAAE